MKRIMRRHPFALGFALQAGLALQLALVAWLAACGPSTREKAIQTTLSTLNIGADTFAKYDLAHEQAIVDRAPSKAVGEQQLEDYRKKRLEVVQGFALAYRAVAVAMTLNDDQSFSAMGAAARQVAQALHDMGVL